MREIKYQAYVKLNPTGRCQMFDVEGIDWKHNRIKTAFGEYSRVGNVLRQYTGLKDKNGRDIYEGDIVKFVARDTNGVHFDGVGSVTFESFEYCIDSDIPFWPMISWSNITSVEVIGNIYENPELIGASEKETSSTANG